MSHDRACEGELSELLLVLQSSQLPLSISDLVQICSRTGLRGHLAVLAEPYLSRVICGQKTIESRFSKVRIPPFGKVQAHDVLLLKEVSGPIRALASVSWVETFGPLPPGGAGRIMEFHRLPLTLDAAFLAQKRDHAYGTLIHLGSVVRVRPLPLAKTDRRAWVVLAEDQVRLI